MATATNIWASVNPKAVPSRPFQLEKRENWSIGSGSRGNCLRRPLTFSVIEKQNILKTGPAANRGLVNDFFS
jgi:hypothetical protein